MITVWRQKLVVGAMIVAMLVASLLGLAWQIEQAQLAHPSSNAPAQLGKFCPPPPIDCLPPG